MIVVASNLHGNVVALNSLLEKVERLKDDGLRIRGVYILGVLGYMPYPKETYETIVKNGVITVRGKFDHLIAEWQEMSEEEKDNLSELESKLIEWNWDKLGRDGRKWLRNEIPTFLAEKIGDNEFLFVYGSPFDPINGFVKPNQPSSYYESLIAPFKKYEMIIVAGYERFVAETIHGKIVCPGSCGIYSDTKPSFAVIDTRSLDVSFEEFDFEKKVVEDKIKEEGLPEEVIKILYHGL
jgi:predicted phosphodiesterase